MRQALGGRSGAIRQIPQSNQLFQYLRLCQIPDQAVQPTGAKDTAHAAADLGADARRAAAILLNQNAFDELIIAQAEQELVRAVGGLQMTLNTGFQRHEGIRKLLAQGLRKISHILKGLSAGHDEPAPYLPGAQAELAMLGKPSSQFIG